MSTCLATGMRAAVDALPVQDYPDREAILGTTARPLDHSTTGIMAGLVA